LKIDGPHSVANGNVAVSAPSDAKADIPMTNIMIPIVKNTFFTKIPPLENLLF
jgi:hypothetical protein